MDVRRLPKSEFLIVKSINDAFPYESMIEPLHMLSATVLSVAIDWPKMLLLALSGAPLEVIEKIEPPWMLLKIWVEPARLSLPGLAAKRPLRFIFCFLGNYSLGRVYSWSSGDCSTADQDIY